MTEHATLGTYCHLMPKVMRSMRSSTLYNHDRRHSYDSE